MNKKEKMMSPSGKVLDWNGGAWLKIAASFPGEEGWFSWFRGEQKEYGLVIGERVLAYGNDTGLFWTDVSVVEQILPCKTKEEVDRYLKLLAFE